MARKKEATIIHPVTMMESLAAYRDDANHLLTTVHHALSFLTDKDIDPRNAIDAVAPMLEEAKGRFEKWNQAD